MNYKTALQTIDTLRALNALKLDPQPMGGYLKFQCPQCEAKASIKI